MVPRSGRDGVPTTHIAVRHDLLHPTMPAAAVAKLRARLRTSLGGVDLVKYALQIIIIVLSVPSYFFFLCFLFFSSCCFVFSFISFFYCPQFVFQPYTDTASPRRQTLSCIITRISGGPRSLPCGYARTDIGCVTGRDSYCT